MQRILAGIYKNGYFCEKVRFLCLDLMPGIENQASLVWEVYPACEEKERWLMAVADALNLHYRRGTIRTATTGMRQLWQARRDRLSPCYTTRLSDVPMARL